MKFVRVFAELLALLIVAANVRALLVLANADYFGVSKSHAFWSGVVGIAVGLGFGVGAYVITWAEGS